MGSGYCELREVSGWPDEVLLRHMSWRCCQCLVESQPYSHGGTVGLAVWTGKSARYEVLLTLTETVNGGEKAASETQVPSATSRPFPLRLDGLEERDIEHRDRSPTMNWIPLIQTRRLSTAPRLLSRCLPPPPPLARDVGVFRIENPGCLRPTSSEEGYWDSRE